MRTYGLDLEGGGPFVLEDIEADTSYTKIGVNDESLM